MRNAGLEEAQAGIKIAGRNINNLRYADDTTIMGESEEELKSLLMKVKEENWKSWLKTQHSKNEDHGFWSHRFMENRWENTGNSDRLYFLGSRITVDSACSHETKRHLLLERKAMTNLDSLFKNQRHYFADKGPYSQSFGFSSSYIGCESWTIKKVECQKLMLSNCGAGEYSWKSPEQWGDEINHF